MSLAFYRKCDEFTCKVSERAHEKMSFLKGRLAYVLRNAYGRRISIIGDGMSVHTHMCATHFGGK